MNKLNIRLLIIAMSLVMIGCGSGSNGSSTTEETTSTPSVETTSSDENIGLNPKGVVEVDKFLDKYYGGNLHKGDYETTEEFNQRREKVFAPIRGNVTFLNQSSSFSHTYDADTATGKITVKFYNSEFDSSVGDTKFLGYKHGVFYESTTSGFPGGEVYHPTRSDSYVFDNLDSGLISNKFICETKDWYGSVIGDLYFIECNYEYYAEPRVAQKYAFNAKISIDIDNSEIDHRFTYNSGNSRTYNGYVGSLTTYTILNGDMLFAEIKVK